MSTLLNCTLNVTDFLVSESYDCADIDNFGSTKQIFLFGKISDSDEDLLNDFTFQFNISSSSVCAYQTTLNETHLYVGVAWPESELAKTIAQIENRGLKLSIGLLLKFEELFVFNLPENRTCSLLTIVKSTGLNT